MRNPAERLVEYAVVVGEGRVLYTYTASHVLRDPPQRTPSQCISPFLT